MKKRYVWIIGALLLLVSLACSLGGIGGGATEPPAEGTTEEATEAPEVTEAATEAPTSEEPEITSNALANLDSYRLRITWQWTPEGGEAEVFVVDQEETRDPPAKRYVISQGEEAMEWVQIGDTAWACFGGTCIQTQEDPEKLASEFGQGLDVDPAMYFEEEKEYVGKETINGINTRHYVLHLSPMTARAFSEGEITELKSEAWVADEPGLPTFLVRFVIEWKGVQNGQPGEGKYIYEVYDVNQPITIEPPEGAPTGLPEDVPAYPNAQDMAIMAGMITFSTPDEVPTVAEFYKNQMPAEGWTLTEESDLGGMITQTWIKDGRTLNLMISAGDEGTGVMILLEE
jgi:hypothetical protein